MRLGVWVKAYNGADAHQFALVDIYPSAANRTQGVDVRSAGLTLRQGELLRNEHIRVGEERAGYAGSELPSWLVWSNKTRVTSTGSSEGRSLTERTSQCGPERGPASGARNDLLDTSNRETRIIGGHCR